MDLGPRLDPFATLAFVTVTAAFTALNVKVRGASEAAERRGQFESEVAAARQAKQVAALEGEASLAKAEARVEEAEATMARLLQEEEEARTIRLTGELTARVMVPNAPLSSSEKRPPVKSESSPEGRAAPASQPASGEPAGTGLATWQKVTAGVTVAVQLLLLVALSTDPMATGPAPF